MKNKIIDIATDLSKGKLTTKEAKEELLYLFGVSNRYYLFSGQENGVKTEYLVDDCLDKEMAIAKIELEYFHFNWVMVKEFNGC